jgi:Uncharacterized protein conserved in bacteria N-term (DUF3322)
LANGKLGYRIEWAETKTRLWGRQKFPERVWFENENEFISALREHEEIKSLRINLALTREHCPELGSWLPVNAGRISGGKNCCSTR